MKDSDKRFKIYEKILGLYPKAYRREFKAEMLQTAADMLDNAPNAKARAGIWLHIAADIPTSVAKQQLHEVGAMYMKDMPSYVKKTSIMGGILLVPFFAAISANAFDKVLYHHTLYGSWLWRFPALGLWVLYLPEAALLIMLISYIAYLARGTEHDTSGWWTRARSLRRWWPLAVPAVLAVGILSILAFHDTAQCWMHAPTVSHVRQSWQCTTQNQSLHGFRKFL